jgi:iron-sulfur cluster protein
VSFRLSPPFPEAARNQLGDVRLRANLARATATIRRRRESVIGELADFEALRVAAAAIKDEAQSRLPELIEGFEARFSAAGGTVHVARDAAEARRIVTGLVLATGEREVVKVKSMTTMEVELNPALEAAGVEVTETDLAELIVQLGHDLPSHIVVPAIHRNRSEIREIFLAEMGRRGRPAPEDLTDAPPDLAGAARAHLRERFLRARVAISGANFAVASSGTLVVVESEGNGRMCTTLADTVISLVGIDKLIPEYGDLEVFLQLLARSATGERMSPYVSSWTGVTAGDGPRHVHVVLLDNGRSSALADPVGRQALRCIRCAACLNVCPVYERVGGHAYGSVYPGPIGAVLTPQLDHVATDAVAASLPWASTLCGACYEVCPVRIDIPRLLVHLRGEIVDRRRAEGPDAEAAVMAAAGFVLGSPRRLRALEALSAAGARLAAALGLRVVRHLPPPLSAWTAARDAPLPAVEPFRLWWRRRGPSTLSAKPPPSGSRAGTVARPGGTGTGALGRGMWRRGAALLGARGTAGRRASDGAPVVAAGAAGRPSGEEPRAAVLGSVRAALAASPVPAVAVPRAYRRAGSSQLAGGELVARFVERVGDYRAEVVMVGSEDVSEAVAGALARSGDHSLVIPADLDEAWIVAARAAGVSIRRDDATLTPPELDEVAAVLTGSALAIAETGTIVLDGGPSQGRRALSLVPDHHVVVVDAGAVVADVPDAVARLDPRRPLTWISGPSATSDIELQRVEGVHGPRRLDVIVVLG